MLRSAIALTLAAILSTDCLAQVPEGWAVASRFQQPNLGPGGLTVFHPWEPGNSWDVTGLPADLVGLGSSWTQSHGANSVLVRPEDGLLVVGEWTRVDGDVLEIHTVELNGRAATRMVRHRIGIRNTHRKASVDQMAWLPDGRVLFTHFGHDSAALAGTDLGILDLTNGALTPVPSVGTPLPSTHFINALTVDSAGSTAYVAYSDRNSVRTASIYAVPLPGGGTAQQVATLTGQAPMQLAVDNQGNLLLATNRAPGLYRWDGSTWSTVQRLASGVNALAFDPTGAAALAMSLNFGLVVVDRCDADGSRTQILRQRHGTSQLTGIAVRPSMARYGGGTAGGHRFVVTPNPDGVSRVGAQDFGLSLDVTPNPAPGILAVGLDRASISIAGVEVLVQPLVTIPFSPSATMHRVALPVPSTPTLAGLRLYAQSLHVDGTGLQASGGLRFTLH